MIADVEERSGFIAYGRRVYMVLNLIPGMPLLLGLVPIPYGFVFRRPDGSVLGTHRRLRGLRDRYELDLCDDPDREIDRRVAIAMAICLDALEGR